MVMLCIMVENVHKLNYYEFFRATCRSLLLRFEMVMFCILESKFEINMLVVESV